MVISGLTKTRTSFTTCVSSYIKVENQLTTFSSLQNIMDQINATTHARTGQYVPGSEPAGLAANVSRVKNKIVLNKNKKC